MAIPLNDCSILSKAAKKKWQISVNRSSGGRDSIINVDHKSFCWFQCDRALLLTVGSPWQECPPDRLSLSLALIAGVSTTSFHASSSEINWYYTKRMRVLKNHCMKSSWYHHDTQAGGAKWYSTGSHNKWEVQGNAIRQVPLPGAANHHQPHWVSMHTIQWCVFAFVTSAFFCTFLFHF